MPEMLWLTEGEEGKFEVRVSARPTSDVTFNLTGLYGDDATNCPSSVARAEAADVGSLPATVVVKGGASATMVTWGGYEKINPSGGTEDANMRVRQFAVGHSGLRAASDVKLNEGDECFEIKVTTEASGYDGSSLTYYFNPGGGLQATTFTFSPRHMRIVVMIANQSPTLAISYLGVASGRIGGASERKGIRGVIGADYQLAAGWVSAVTTIISNSCWGSVLSGQ